MARTRTAVLAMLQEEPAGLEVEPPGGSGACTELVRMSRTGSGEVGPRGEEPPGADRPSVWNQLWIPDIYRGHRVRAAGLGAGRGAQR